MLCYILNLYFSVEMGEKQYDRPQCSVAWQLSLNVFSTLVKKDIPLLLNLFEMFNESWQCVFIFMCINAWLCKNYNNCFNQPTQ